MSKVEFASRTEGGIRAVVRVRKRLLDWFALNQRELPWRTMRTPYRVWVSEIMLQQTRVAAVVERYQEFLRLFPTVERLANADEQSVLAVWSGLGYYRRARMLHEAARVVVSEYGGELPRRAVELKKLPGIGAYTAAAIASLAYGEAVAVVDGNVERVVQRLAGIGSEQASEQRGLKREIERLAETLLDREAPGAFNEAMMELGATVCLPQSPLCSVCPVARFCATCGEHPKRKRPVMRREVVGCAVALRAGEGGREVLLEQRGEAARVMPGLWQLPELTTVDFPEEDLLLRVRHAIMQVNYEVRVRRVNAEEAEALPDAGGARRWVRSADLPGMALTGLARKVLSRLKGMESGLGVGGGARDLEEKE